MKVYTCVKGKYTLNKKLVKVGRIYLGWIVISQSLSRSTKWLTNDDPPLNFKLLSGVQWTSQHFQQALKNLWSEF